MYEASIIRPGDKLCERSSTSIDAALYAYRSPSCNQLTTPSLALHWVSLLPAPTQCSLLKALVAGSSGMLR
jgi:hypothetical protein